MQTYPLSLTLLLAPKKRTTTSPRGVSIHGHHSDELRPLYGTVVVNPLDCRSLEAKLETEQGGWGEYVAGSFFDETPSRFEPRRYPNPPRAAFAALREYAQLEDDAWFADELMNHYGVAEL